MGDTEEAKAVANVYGAHALEKKLWVSSTKSMMGHLLGAAGAVEAAVCIKAIETGVIPPPSISKIQTPKWRWTSCPTKLASVASSAP